MAAPNEDGLVEVNNAYQPIINVQRNDPSWVLIPGQTYYISGNFWSKASVDREPARQNHWRSVRNRKARAIGRYIPQQGSHLVQAFRISKLRIAKPYPEHYREAWEFDGDAEYMAAPYETMDNGNNIYGYQCVDIDEDLHIYLPPGPGVSTAAQHHKAAQIQIQKEARGDASIRNNSTTPIFPKLRPTEMQTLDLEQKTWLIDHNLQGLPFAEIQSWLSNRLSDADWMAVDEESGTWNVKEDNFKGLMDRVAKGGRRRRTAASRRRKSRLSSKRPRQKRIRHRSRKRYIK
jgi:hypothetical protein